MTLLRKSVSRVRNINKILDIANFGIKLNNSSLQMNERKPTWNCPVCDSKANYSDLLIDGYFQETLESKVRKILFLRLLS